MNIYITLKVWNLILFIYVFLVSMVRMLLAINFFWYAILKARWMFSYSASMWKQLSISILIIILFLITLFFSFCSSSSVYLFSVTIFVDELILLVSLWCQAKLAKLRRELLTPTSKGGGGAGEGFDVTKSGDSRVGLVGFPSVGKSTLLNKLTGTFSEVWKYSTSHTSSHTSSLIKVE